MDIYVCMCVYVYIDIERERERERLLKEYNDFVVDCTTSYIDVVTREVTITVVIYYKLAQCFIVNC